MKPMNQFYQHNPMINHDYPKFQFANAQVDFKANDHIIQPCYQMPQASSHTHKVTGLFSRLVTPRFAL